MEGHYDDDDRIEPPDHVIISHYLTTTINNGDFLPNHYLRDLDARVYNLNPWRLFTDRNRDYYLFVKRRTESSGKTDGSESGCWRIIGRDKLIKSEDTGKFLGFKKILKFCDKEKMKKKRSSEEDEEQEQRIWVMQEYGLVNKWKQDQVICKILLLNQSEVTSLLAKHLSFLPKPPFRRRRLCPRLDFNRPNEPKDESITFYLKFLFDDDRRDWGRRFWPSERVYTVVPWWIVWPLRMSILQHEGHYFFVNKTETCGRSDRCEGGCWRIIRRDKVVISKRTSKVLGFKRFYKFCHKPGYVKPVFWFGEFEVDATWVMEEYRVYKKRLQGRVICRIRVLFPVQLDELIRYGD
ncbi:unnamed protein product [Microthlaspi erraticum]|uniref:NAC domain-containing protein n=1 Tax=Microthlaspi erraticum TaxID=1685480 RepID=A0A6D2I7X8_9BRAS|nr:unnamed protein product [Microthlaspi erraticum]